MQQTLVALNRGMYIHVYLCMCKNSMLLISLITQITKNKKHMLHEDKIHL